MTIETSCPFCGSGDCIAVDDNGYRAYLAGKNIDEALPELTESQRERLVSGICDKCWDNLMPEDK